MNLSFGIISLDKYNIIMISKKDTLLYCNNVFKLTPSCLKYQLSEDVILNFMAQFIKNKN